MITRTVLLFVIVLATSAAAQESRARRELLESVLPLPPGGGKLMPFGDATEANGVPMSVGVVESTKSGPELLEFYAREFDKRRWPWTGLKQNLAVVPWPSVSATVPDEELQVSVMVLEHEGGATVVLSVADMRAFAAKVNASPAAEEAFPAPAGVKPSVISIHGEGGGKAVTFDAPLSTAALSEFYATRFGAKWRALGLRAGAQHFELDHEGQRWRVRVQAAGSGSRLSAVAIGGAP